MEKIPIIIFIILLIIIQKEDEIKDYFSSNKIRVYNGGRYYTVSNVYQNTKSASSKMKHIHGFIIKLLRHLKKKYILNNLGTIYQKKFTNRLLLNFNPDTVFENIPKNTTDTSYVKNKGKKFAICLREKRSGKHRLHADSLLEFVVLHELAHIGSIGYRHKQEFWNNFKFLLQEAKEAGIHHPIDYKKNPTIYCGVSVTYNPFYDL